MSVTGPFSGFGGVVYIGAAAVAKVMEWTYDESIDVSEDGVKGTLNKHISIGNTEGSGSINCLFDDDDATGQDLLVLGASIAVKLYGDASNTGTVPKAGDPVFSGTVLISGVDTDSPEGAAKATRTFRYTGLLTEGVHPVA